ncbi:hypothetical protein [Runella slithyformis]|uniref:Glycoside hydrolase family 65 N-terminal domain-containing protein n=1 Tax=Runella slithyformis (strain ATCC 29530 / DSM 19594 / LMG 11500 / NCIMB 11436 / LSU 4) TaxID=761193 RepID=A0A7U3ZKS3_RUNSL|nr:hypothetical protein [Runella slithyformis]AEI48996.1 hypothetical protein Runsl_2595 [Runella slithyformis DSM 19594]
MKAIQRYCFPRLRAFLVVLATMYCVSVFSQNVKASPRHVVATDINPARYFGVTVANGMVGLVSSPQPRQVQDVVLNGVYDYYQRGRVSNILKSFNHVNMYLDVDRR